MARKIYWTDFSAGDYADIDPMKTIAIVPIAAVEQHGPQLPVGTLASSLEAILGAIYTVHGYAAADTFLQTCLGPEFTTGVAVGGQDNYKAVLQEYTQQRYKSVPEYRLVAEIGPEHDRYYDIDVWVAGERLGGGRGRSKKAAEQAAAERAFEHLGG